MLIFATSPTHFPSMILLTSPWSCESHPISFKHIHFLLTLASDRFSGLQQRTQLGSKCSKGQMVTAACDKSQAKAKPINGIYSKFIPSLECNYFSNYVVSFWEYFWLKIGPWWIWIPHYETLSDQGIIAAKNKDIPVQSNTSCYNKETHLSLICV